MKKILTIISVILFVFVTQAANVRMFWTQTPPVDSKLVKIYYGSQLNTYTTNRVFDLTTLPFLTNSMAAYDTFNCQPIISGNTNYIKISGLQYTQQFYWAYSYINTNGVEGPIIANSVCGFTVTNKNDDVIEPSNLRTK